MIRSRGLVYVTAADFIVRSAYQMGKTPLLPLFAAALGAGDAFLGFIVSVSTLTGMVLKPFFGVLSDRWGRRGWLLVGTGFFALMPFAYRFVHTPEQLFALRMFHGLATAIYGPVTLAYVSEQSKSRRAERLAWFGMARNAGYIVGPAAAGLMLMSMDAVSVFTVIGLLSGLAFLPILFLTKAASSTETPRSPLVRQALRSLVHGGRTPAVWLAGGLEATMYLALYATKAFLPIYALSTGYNVAVAGIFFAIQEATHMLLNPLGGRIGDRLGYKVAVPLGMVLLGATLPLLTVQGGVLFLLMLAALIGVSQALAFPSTVALVSDQVNPESLATGMGLIGTLKNAGKVAGPAVAGLLIHWSGYAFTFQLLGLGLALGAGMVWQGSRFSRQSSRVQKTVHV